MIPSAVSVEAVMGVGQFWVMIRFVVCVPTEKICFDFMISGVVYCERISTEVLEVNIMCVKRGSCERAWAISGFSLGLGVICIRG